jgi:1-acyl-sn-glycerol-3-phosphate acyltransferase
VHEARVPGQLAPDDPRRARSPPALAGFNRYLRWYFRRNFNAVRVSRDGLPEPAPGRSLIVYSNHSSWWDPALFVVLSAMLFPDRVGFGPMDVAALGQYGILRRMGVFGVETGTRRGAAQFLNVCCALLADPTTLLWITPEGAFTDPRRRPIRLRSGLAHLLRRIPDAAVVPLAIEYTFWNERRPEVLARFGPPLQANRAASVAELTGRLEAALARAMDVLADQAMTRDQTAFVRLLAGNAGVGGVYDLWRRGAALAAGRRFDPSHGGREA